MNKIKKIESVMILVILLVSIFYTTVNAQEKQLPEEVRIQIENYKVNAIKNRNAGNDNVASTYLNKVAYLYWEYFIYDESIKYFQQVLDITKASQNKNGEEKVLENMAFVYSDMERYDKSVECFTSSLELLKSKGNKEQIANGISNLAIAYNNNGQYDKAISLAEEGLNISKALNNMKLMRSFYGILHESYDKKGDKEKSVEYFSLYSTIDKHIQQQLFKKQEKLNNEKMKKVEAQKDIAIQAKNRTEKVLKSTKDTLEQSKLEVDLLNAENAAKEARLKVKEATLKVKEAKLESERRLRYGMFAIFLFICIVTFLVFRQMQEKKRVNKTLSKLNVEIQKKNNQILDSINYARHIQEAILPIEENMKESFPESFVLYKPRDIVSGDFYWYTTNKDYSFVAAIDCTGHGVPGAFMSMIGNTLLNEVVNEKEIFEPAKVLEMLNKKVGTTLNQNSNSDGFSEDGMDMTFCCYDRKNKTLQIAMANHIAIIYNNGKISTIEGDYFSVGGNVGVDEVHFENYNIDLTTDTVIYMFSDGYQDQFGGDNNKKYMLTKFINFIESIQDKTMKEQKVLLDKEYNEWRGDSRQIDDVLVIGIKFTV
jgi:serine phosphatase RsbU (regulator of sigma subunit)